MHRFEGEDKEDVDDEDDDIDDGSGPLRAPVFWLHRFWWYWGWGWTMKYYYYFAMIVMIMILMDADAHFFRLKSERHVLSECTGWEFSDKSFRFVFTWSVISNHREFVSIFPLTPWGSPRIGWEGRTCSRFPHTFTYTVIHRSAVLLATPATALWDISNGVLSCYEDSSSSSLSSIL